MKRFYLQVLLVSTLSMFVSGASLPVAFAAEEKAKGEQEKADAQDDPKQDDEQGKKKQRPRRARVPKHQARPNPSVQRTAQSLLTDEQMFVPEAAKNLQAAPRQQPQPNQKVGQQAGANRRQPNPPFWSPRQQGLSPAATFRLESMGNHVQLSPAMRLHLGRTQGGANAQPTIQIPSKSLVPGQGAGRYYPGASQTATKKPFADLERPASGLETYWPLLLEGRQDPNTGLIIWSLP